MVFLFPTPGNNFLSKKIHPLQHDNTAKPTLSKKVSCESPKAAFLHG